MLTTTRAPVCVAALLLAPLPAAGRQAEATVPARPSPAAAQAANELRVLLAGPARAGDRTAVALRSKLGLMCLRLSGLKTRADDYTGRTLSPAERAEVAEHNAHCKAALDDLLALVDRSKPLLHKAGLQLSNVSLATARALVKSGRYGTTASARFVSDFAREAYGYPGLRDRSANETIDWLGKEKDGWRVVSGSGLQEKLLQAQGEANRGRLVVAGWRNAKGEGHVAVVLPGPLESGHGLQVPRSAQAGSPTFALGRLSQGFTREQLGELVVYVRRPGDREDRK